MTLQTRFSGAIGNDYDLFKLPAPHFDELQQRAGQLVYENYRSKERTGRFNVLEIGCGTGETTRHILESDMNVHVLTIDNDFGMLEQARDNLASFGDCVQFICGDALAELEKLAANGVHFDAFVSGLTLHNLDRTYRAELIERIVQLLVPSGIYVNADKYALDEPALHAKDLETQLGALKVFDKIGRPDLREVWTKHYLEDEATRCTETDERVLLSTCGFQNFQICYRKNMEAIITATK